MVATECPREQDLIDALCAGRWGVPGEEELRTHVAGCPGCADLVEVAGPLLAERHRLWSDIRVPSAGTVWWRAQIRARQEAASVAARPLALAYGAACVGLVVLVAVLSMLVTPAAGAWLANVSDLLAIELPRATLPDRPQSGLLWWVLVLAAGAWLVLTPVAIYLAVGKE